MNSYDLFTQVINFFCLIFFSFIGWAMFEYDMPWYRLPERILVSLLVSLAYLVVAIIAFFVDYDFFSRHLTFFFIWLGVAWCQFLVYMYSRNKARRELDLKNQEEK